MISPSTGRVQGPRSPTLRKSCASASRASICSMSSNTSRCRAPGVGSTSSRTRSPSRAPRVNNQRRSSKERTGSSSPEPRAAPCTSSPPRRPAACATEPATGLASSALGSWTPLQFTTEYNSTAKSRLAMGPAATMAARERKGCVLKARCRSASGTGASRSSSMRT